MSLIYLLATVLPGRM